MNPKQSCNVYFSSLLEKVLAGTMLTGIGDGKSLSGSELGGINDVIDRKCLSCES